MRVSHEPRLIQAGQSQGHSTAAGPRSGGGAVYRFAICIFASVARQLASKMSRITQRLGRRHYYYVRDLTQWQALAGGRLADGKSSIGIGGVGEKEVELRQAPVARSQSSKRSVSPPVSTVRSRTSFAATSRPIVYLTEGVNSFRVKQLHTVDSGWRESRRSIGMSWCWIGNFSPCGQVITSPARHQPQFFVRERE